MSSFKSPELLVNGRIVHVVDNSYSEVLWKQLSTRPSILKSSLSKECHNHIAPIEHPFSLYYITTNVRGWPRMLIEVWRADKYGRHNILGYGTAALPMGSGDHTFDIPCWRPMSTWYDKFIGINSYLQHPDIICSTLNKHGLRTTSGCIVTVKLATIGRNFMLHGVLR